MIFIALYLLVAFCVYGETRQDPTPILGPSPSLILRAMGLIGLGRKTLGGHFLLTILGQNKRHSRERIRMLFVIKVVHTLVSVWFASVCLGKRRNWLRVSLRAGTWLWVWLGLIGAIGAEKNLALFLAHFPLVPLAGYTMPPPPIWGGLLKKGGPNSAYRGRAGGAIVGDVAK